MKSIRLSMIVYFLLLLAAGLGAVSVFVYETTRQSLLDKQAKVQALLHEQHHDRAQAVRDKFDNDLVSQARTMASLAQFQFQWSRGRYHGLHTLGLLSAGLSPSGYVLMPVWAAHDPRAHAPLSEQLFLASVTEIQFNEDVLLAQADDAVREYFQIDSQWGNTWRSRSLGNRSFPVDRAVFAIAVPFFNWSLDDATLERGQTVRRVTLKVPVARVRSFFPPPPTYTPTMPSNRPEASSRGGNQGFRSGGSAGSARPRTATPTPPPQPAEGFERPQRSFFIQCAAETTRRDAALTDLDAQLEQELSDLDVDSTTTLAGLRDRLLAISMTAFAATVIGGFWLVRLGLSPLRRLSEAVSRVSEKDFRLQFDEPRLPNELQPIVERLTQTLEQLKRAFAREKQAAADISHELRTPLAALLTTIELGLRKQRKPEEYHELLRDCYASGQQMNQLVERLLALARLDAGVDTLRTHEVDVTALAEQCTALVRPLAEARELSLRLHCGEPVYLKADPNKLREVLTNLLHNAIEYNRPHGSVELAVERENGHLRLEVRDTGIGIAPQACEHIFERFYRADPSRQADGLHAGLGLAIVKGYVDLMGGTIAVESEEGQGSTFRVQLPA